MKAILNLALLVALYGQVSISGPARSVNGKRVVCYFGSWAVYRWGNAKISDADLDCSLCTHFIYTFVGLDPSTNSVTYLDAYNDIGDDWKRGLIPSTRDKCRNSGAKYMVAVGGWNEGSEKYSKMACDPQSRATFVNSVVELVKNHGLDGFDLDWEYPGQRGGSSNDKHCFSALIKELRHKLPTGSLLSAAVSANKNSLSGSYIGKDMAQNLDFVNVMAYDLHGSWEDKTGHNAPLYARPADYPNDGHLNIASAMQAWIDLGVPAEKLNLGLGTYGRSFNLLNPSQTSIGAPAGGVPPSGWIPEAGFYAYNDLCFNNKSWTTVWDDVQKVPYAYSGNKWVGYDDPLSLRLKTCFAKSMNIGGMMFWSLETDDFKGICNQGRFPLVRSVIHALEDKSCGSGTDSEPTTEGPRTTEEISKPAEERPVEQQNDSERLQWVPDIVEPEQEPEQTTSSTTTQSPITTTSSPVIEQRPPQDLSTNSKGVVCERVGQYIRDPSDCSSFYQCTHGSGNSLVANKVSCGRGLSFDENISTCNFRTLVKC